MLVDEVQDFASRDFDLLAKLCEAEISVLLVGDFHQSTYATSQDGKYGTALLRDYDLYLATFKDIGLTVDTERLINSHRCAPAVCEFISERLGINIESNRNTDVNIEVIENQDRADEVLGNDDIIKLFFQKSEDYVCRSKNWGKSKGENHYHDVCIVLNATTEKEFKKEGVMNLANSTRNKLYVACTRARGNLYFVSHKLLTQYTNK